MKIQIMGHDEAVLYRPKEKAVSFVFLTVMRFLVTPRYETPHFYMTKSSILYVHL